MKKPCNGRCYFVLPCFWVLASFFHFLASIGVAQDPAAPALRMEPGTEIPIEALRFAGMIPRDSEPDRKDACRMWTNVEAGVTITNVQFAPVRSEAGIVSGISKETVGQITPRTLLTIATEICGQFSPPEKPDQLTAALVVTFIAERENDNVSFSVSPRVAKSGNLPVTGRLPWTPLAATFAIPANTVRVKFELHTRTTGEMRLKPFRASIAEESRRVSFATPLSLPTRQEGNFSQFEKRSEELQKVCQAMGILPADQLVQPGAGALSVHPRLFFPFATAENLRRQLTPVERAVLESEAALTAARAAEWMRKNKDDVKPEELFRLAEDLPWMILAPILLPKSESAKASGKTGRQLIDRLASTKFPGGHDEQARALAALAVTYDWIVAGAKPDDRTVRNARSLTIRLARHLRSPENESAWNDRGKRAWLDPVLTRDHCAMVLAAAALWGEKEAPLLETEPAMWLGEAATHLALVFKSMTPGGAHPEGFGNGMLPPMVTTLAVLDSLFESPIRSEPAWSAIAPAYGAAALPAASVFLPFGGENGRGGWNPHTASALWYLARRNQDPAAGTLAERISKSLACEESDPSLPAYATVLAAGKKAIGDAAKDAEPIVAQASVLFPLKPGEKQSTGIPPGGGKVTWHANVPKPGLYRLGIVGATAETTKLKFSVDGAPLFREACATVLPRTGRHGGAHWLLLAGEAQPILRSAYLLPLPAGPHEIEIETDGALDLGSLALIPSHVPEDKVASHTPGAQRLDLADLEPPMDWQAFFFRPRLAADATTEESKPPSSWTEHDLGLAVARFDESNAWLGIKCGLPLGSFATKQVREQIENARGGNDAGGFAYFVDGIPVIRGFHLEGRRDTSLGLPVAAALGKKDDRPQWFGQAAPDFYLTKPEPSPGILSHEEGGDYITYLLDLTPAYAASAEQGDKKEPVFSKYLRRLILLENGVLIIADRITAANGCVVGFRLPVPVEPKNQGDNVFEFTSGSSKVRITDYSPGRIERHLLETEESTGGRNDQMPILSFETSPTINAQFAVLIGVDGNDDGIRLRAEPTRLVITGLRRGYTSFDWN